jgi:signal transduction histidine kinase
MNFRTWQMAAVGLTGLLALIAVFGVITARRSSINVERMGALYRHHRQVDVQLHKLRSEVHLSSIFIRDYLLDTAADRDAAYREQLAAYRHSNLVAVDELMRLLPDAGDARETARALLGSLEKYWEAFAPLFEWTPAQKVSQSAEFLKKEVVPRREEVLAIAREIEELNSVNLSQQNREASGQAAANLGELQTLLWQTLGLGVIVSAVSISRFRTLELRADEQRALAESARAQMRALSMQIVATQEEERKELSRELHDDIGQMLTGLRMILGRLEREGGGSATVAPVIAESRALLDEAVKSVRDLAMGLRPSMLDDFGLQPALEWLVRDFSRRSRLKVASTVTGNLAGLVDPHRTCVYRTVQEALTNCSRHASASSVVVQVIGSNDDVVVTVRDDGVGIHSKDRGSGLGLRGLEERAHELKGTLTIDSTPGSGTMVKLWLPIAPVSEDR